jgi:leucine dehydrogenase
MIKITEIKEKGYERIVLAECSEVGLCTCIAIHNTQHGPALGGSRFYQYTNFEAAKNDALQLSRSMTYKSTLAGIPFGGGKATTLLKPGQQVTPELLEAYAEALNLLKGEFITSVDIGVSQDDIEYAAKFSPYFLTGEGTENISPMTIWGLWAAINTVSSFLELEKPVKIFVEGLGKVGFNLAEILTYNQDDIYGYDISENQREKAAEIGITVRDNMLGEKYDIYSPCAKEMIITQENLQEFNIRAICGATNAQINDPKLPQILHQKGILYAPDYLVNAGGVIAAGNIFNKKYDEKLTSEQVRTTIVVNTNKILEEAKRKNCPPLDIANNIVESRLKFAQNTINCKTKLLN